MKLKQYLTILSKAQTGAAIVEYAIMLGFIAAISIPILSALGVKTGTVFSNANTLISGQAQQSSKSNDDDKNKDDNKGNNDDKNKDDNKGNNDDKNKDDNKGNNDDKNKDDNKGKGNDD